MKLHELGDQRQQEITETVIATQYGNTIDFSVLGPKRIQGMMARVQKILGEHRRSPSFHHSEKNDAYLQLMLVEQALSSRLKEAAQAQVIDVNSPETKAVLKKVEQGSPLNQQETEIVKSVAMLKKEGRQHKKMVKEQSELQQAQVVLASQDMIDRLQGMLEDISEMQFKDLPALADSIKNDIGLEQATAFQSSASTVLNQLLQALQTGKQEMDAAQAGLTGQQTIPGIDPMVTSPDAEVDAEVDGEEDIDLSLDSNLDDQADDQADSNILGRERR